jgi:phosphatidylglycerol:prolipoprotein diacylglycerol transferase
MSFVLPLAYWVHHFSPFLGPHWGNFGIRYYGLAYVMGFLTAAWLLTRYAVANRSHLPANKVSDLMVALVLGVLIGGRLGYFLLYEPDTLFNPPWAFFMVWKGGMASHGGFIGVTLALWWFARTEKISFLHLGDLVASVAPAGLFFGRIANFINGELWGRPASVPWAVIFSDTGGGNAPRHPSQLYEAALEGALLLAFMQWRFWRGRVTEKKPGRLAGEFFVAYALVRMFCELFREPDQGVSLIFGLSRGTFYSIFLIIAGAWLITRRSRAPAA